MGNTFDALYTSTAELKRKPVQTYQNQFEKFFQALTAKSIDRQDYKGLCDQLHRLLPHYLPETQSLNRRINRKCDGSAARTCGEWAVEIYDGVQRERTIVTAWVKHMIETKRCKSCTIHDNGMDNTGCVQYVRTNVNSNPDFLLTLDECALLPDKAKLEVKINNWGLAKATFKVHNLENYVKENAFMLMVWVDHPKSFWTIITPKQIETLLTLPRQLRREMGGMCEQVQILEDDYPKYLGNIEEISLCI